MFDIITVYFAVFIAGAVFGACATALVKYQHAARLNVRDTKLRMDAQYEAAHWKKLAERFAHELRLRRQLDDTDDQ